MAVRILLSILVWVGAIGFFVLFGSQVLSDVLAGESFLTTFFILELGTAVLLYIVTLLYKMFDKQPGAGAAFGVVGSAVGLTLDAVALWNTQILFPTLTPGQLIAFTIWMSFAYAIYLVVPRLADRKDEK